MIAVILSYINMITIQSKYGTENHHQLIIMCFSLKNIHLHKIHMILKFIMTHPMIFNILSIKSTTTSFSLTQKFPFSAYPIQIFFFVKFLIQCLNSTYALFTTITFPNKYINQFNRKRLKTAQTHALPMYAVTRYKLLYPVCTNSKKRHDRSTIHLSKIDIKITIFYLSNVNSQSFLCRFRWR